MSSVRAGWVATALVLLAVGGACTRDAAPVPAPSGVPTPAPSGSTAEPSTPVPGASPSAAPGASPNASPGASASPRASGSPVSPGPAAPPSATAAGPTPSTPVESTVAPRPERSRTPVDLDRPSGTGTGLAARLVSIRPIEAKAQLPGEIAGPALALTVEVTNSRRVTADLSAVVVNLLDADEAPGAELTAPPAQPLPGRVLGRERVRGVYVFRVPKDKRRPVTVTVSIADAPVLVFTGNAG